MFKRIVVIFLTLFMCSVSFSWASFIYIAPQNESQDISGKKAPRKEKNSPRGSHTTKDVNIKSSGVVQVGWGNPDNITAFGSDMPLPFALEMVKPTGWSIRYNKDIESLKNDILVNLNVEDEPWINALTQMGQYDVGLAVDWVSESIFVNLPEKNISDVISEIKNKSMAKPNIIEDSGKDNIDENIVFSNKENHVFKLNPGDIESQIREWVSKFDYTLVWNMSSKYSIDNNLHYSGDFYSILDSLFTDFFKNGVDMNVDIYRGNKVLYVSDKRG